ncbi:hypothetical protein EAF04_002405 [Stromatinia cepivora]|nr:hypothetical protein EAF04_002405 [Stromatinia cepivora]
MKSLTPWEYIMARRWFTLFPGLPVEIRQFIWRMTLEVRLVEVWPKGGKYDGFCSRTPLPAAMKACRDSRTAVLPLYPLLFGGVVIEASIRFNFDLDTLYIDWKIQERLASFLLSITPHEAGKFQSIAIDGDIRYGRVSYDERKVNMAKLRRDPSLRHQVQTNCNSMKFEEDELQLFFSALSSMSMLKKLHLVYDAAPMDSEGLYQKRDEFSQLIIFDLWEVF